MKNLNDDHLALFIDANRLVRKPEIQRLLGVSRSTLGRRIKAGQFPSPSLLQSGRPCWLFKDIQAWLPH
ncbi:helix-turn-helix transcriptional regulator [Shewanella gaetbuli]|uniref:AlpA family phage regulatory protein n=1 Tax=Shewanella gaetbuli TaxID=220752 RepID=A0A9X1ZWH9_9GAMM|nr:AlpA family phage regulatory protein [Shewanella gaetbuli]MCL1143706.1 AlpA family phage regulatory protein [Shewanella gaetbuli]